ncbi:MAG: phosphate ABC transporter permease PstA [Opitutales bacterium]|nr:phosphate ABC transporter permease PstA [Opitutales bacterium]
MREHTRKLFDYAFTGLGIASITFMVAILVIVLVPIFARGVQAVIFKGTVEHRLLHLEKFSHGDEDAIRAEYDEALKARQFAWDMLDNFKKDLKAMPSSERGHYRKEFADVEAIFAELMGPRPGEHRFPIVRMQYGQNRWDRAQVKLHELMYYEQWTYENGESHLQYLPRKDLFTGTSLEGLFDYTESHLEEMLKPKITFYWRFLTDSSIDAHIFGGIWPELLGTIYLTIGSMLFAVPFGILTAIYLAEYAKEGMILSTIRSCISTLSGVPSIVFGLIGLAFFINYLKVSPNKSVLAGALTLGLLVLPTIIRTSEEAIKAVPHAYKEAAMGLGAGRWFTVVKVILPASLPGIMTGIVLSMGRAAGETAPIIFTAAVSVGQALSPIQALSEPTPALSWNIYNLCTEHEAVEEIRHVQYGMVVVLIGVVISLSLIAILMRARIQKKMKR